MRGCVLAERVVATSNVAALGTPSEVEPPAAGLQALHTTGSARWNGWIDGIRHVCTSSSVAVDSRAKAVPVGQKARYWCTDRTEAEPSPTAAATRLVEPDRRSPTPKRPGWLVSKGSGDRASACQS